MFYWLLQPTYSMHLEEAKRVKTVALALANAYGEKNKKLKKHIAYTSLREDIFLCCKETRRHRKGLAAGPSSENWDAYQSPRFHSITCMRFVFQLWMNGPFIPAWAGRLSLTARGLLLCVRKNRIQRDTGSRNDHAPSFLGPVKWHRGLDFMGHISLFQCLLCKKIHSFSLLKIISHKSLITIGNHPEKQESNNLFSAYVNLV